MLNVITVVISHNGKLFQLFAVTWWVFDASFTYNLYPL